MKKILPLVATLCFTAVSAQLKPVLVGEAKFSADLFMGIDNFNWRYYVKDDAFFKEKDGQALQYKNISLGKIRRADILNPMSIVLFYEDFNSVVQLDNQLNEIRRINFSEHPEPIVATATGNAAQNRLWVYNSLTQQLGLFDYLKNSYVPITQQLKGTIRHYETDFNHFDWVDDQGNRFSCDLFGKIASLGKIGSFDSIQFISERSALFAKGGSLYYFTRDGNQPQLIDLGKKSASGFWYGAQILTIFTTDGISIYNLKLP